MSRYHADHRLTLILMILIVGLLNADQNIINATLGPIEKEFQVDDAAIGLMSGLFTLLGAVISLIWGYWSDKSNRKNLFTISVLIGQIPCLLTAFAANYQQFFILRILTGIGVGASFPTIFSMLGDMYSEKERAVAVTWMTTVMGIGQIAGELLGGYLSPSFGWRLPFILVAVPNLLILVIFHLIVAEPKRGMREEAFEELVDAGFVYPKTIKLRDYLNLIKVRTNIYLFIQGILGTIPWGAIPLFLIKFLNENKSLSIAAATTTFLLFGIGNVVGTIGGGIIGGALLKKKPSYLAHFCALTTVLGAVATLALFILVPAGNLEITLILGFIASFLVSITGPNVRTMLLDTNLPENRGAIFSIFNLTDSVGTGIGKYVAGLLSVSYGLGMAMNLSTVVWFPCAVFLGFCAVALPRDIRTLHEKLAVVAAGAKDRTPSAGF